MAPLHGCAMMAVLESINFNTRRRQFKIRAKFFLRFFTSFDRTRAANYEKQLFALFKYRFPVKKYEKNERCHFF